MPNKTVSVGRAKLLSNVALAEFGPVVSPKRWEDLDIYLAKVLQSAGQGVWDYNIETGERYYSPTWREIRGIGDNHVFPTTDEEWLLIVHPEDRALASQMTEAINAGDVDDVAYEYRERHVSGRWIWIMCRGQAIRDPSTGRVYRVIGTDTDITRIKKAEVKQKALHDRLELAVSIANIGIWEFNLSTETLTCDTRLRAIYEIPQDQVEIPRNIWETSLHPDDLAWCLKITRERELDRSDYDLEYRILTPSGAVKHISSRVMYRENLFDGPTLFGVNWDTTEQKLSQETLENSHRDAMIRNAELEIVKRALEHKSMIDPLTRVFNRYKIEDIRQDLRQNRPFRQTQSAVLHIDLDRFKQINDTIGHAAGDFVLNRCADILRDCCGTNSTVIRVGGDEFVVHFVSAPPAEALTDLSRTIIERISQPCEFDGHICRVAASIGIAVETREEFQDDANDIFVHADLALNHAKHSGRGQYQFFGKSIQETARKKKRDADDFLGALERHELFVVYQPQVSLKDGSVSGIEALVRWQSPLHGVLSASEFISIARDLHMVARLDEVVFDLVVADLSSAAKSGIAIPKVSINISAERLSDPALDLTIRKAKSLPFLVSFELLESIILDDQDSPLMDRINAARAAGIGIEIDDFGSSHASILSLMRVRPDRVKIDRAIVSSLGVSPDNLKLVQGIISVGHSFAGSVLAEGVETIEQLRVLMSIGCDEVQGFAVAHPMPLNALSAFLGQERTAPWLAKP